MKDSRQIVDRWRQGAGSVLITLVRVQGSSYRRAGARLLLTRDGAYTGSVSAGCLEADLLRKAAWLVRNGATTERYSTFFDDASDMPFGLGCGGVLDILLEPVGTPECEALLNAMESALNGTTRFAATWLPANAQPLRRAIFDSDGRTVFSSDGLSSDELSQAWSAAQDRNHLHDHLFVEQLAPPPRIFLFGAGDDARPLAAMALQLGWNTFVTDGRSHLLRQDRFLGSTILAGTQEAARRIQPGDAVVVMTHSFEQDKHLLPAVLSRNPSYVGLVGSRQRSSLLITEAAAALDWPISECCERVCAPAGLDIGGEGAEAIALAILAEAQMFRAGKRDATRKLSVEVLEQWAATPAAPVRCALDLT